MCKCRWIGADRCIHVGTPVFTRVLALASMLVGLTGCHHNNKPPPRPQPSIQEPLPGGPVAPAGRPVVPIVRPDAMDASTGTLSVDAASPSITAKRAQEYVNSMQPAIDRQSAAAGDARMASAQMPPNSFASSSATAPTAPSGTPSAVQWEQPRLSLSPELLQSPGDKTAPPPAPQQAVVTADGANSTPNVPRSINPPSNQVTYATAPRTSPAVESGSLSSKDSLDQVLASRVHDYPHDLSAQLDYQLERFITDQPVPDLSTLSSLPGEDSEMLAAVLDGLANFRNSVRQDGNMLMARKVAPFIAAAERLQAHSGLTLPTVRLCTDVVRFGEYKPFEGNPAHFEAGKASQFIVYCEVANFSSEQVNGQEWRTDLKETAMLYSDQGTPEWKEVPNSVTDSSRSHRHDFFIAQMLTLPASLAPGKHLLKITVEDTQSHRVAETTVPLLVIAAPQ